MKATRPWAVLSVMMTLVGCTLTRSDVRDATPRLPSLGHSGRLVTPKQCALRMVIASRPLKDEALDGVVWHDADVQAVDPEARRVLEANGLRLGVVTGELPPEVQAILDAPPPNRIDPVTILLPDGESTLVDLGASRESLTLLLSREGTVAGKPYKDARGHVRVFAERQGESGVAIRLVPELHHGPVSKGWGTAPGGGTYAPQQLVVKTGQAEESFRELAATLALGPGQVSVMGALPDRRGSLGHFLFTAPEPNSDRLVQKVLFVWASRSEDGTLEGIAPEDLRPYDPAAPVPEPAPMAARAKPSATTAKGPEDGPR